MIWLVGGWATFSVLCVARMVGMVRAINSLTETCKASMAETDRLYAVLKEMREIAAKHDPRAVLDLMLRERDKRENTQ